MITKIKKIENMGIFSGYSSNVPPYSEFKGFKELNVIYGMNGSGKTTLSKLFEKLANEDEEVEKLEDGKNDYPDAKYELIDENEKAFLLSEQMDLSIKIFSKSYVEKNIKFEEGSANSLIGEDIIIKSEDLTKNRNCLKKAEKINKRLQGKYEKEKNNIISAFRGVARIIKSDIATPATEKYDYPDAEKEYGKIEHERIVDAELDKKKQIVGSKEKGTRSLLQGIENKGERMLADAKIICETKSGAKALEELEYKEEKAKWIGDGLELHGLLHGKEISDVDCQFCLNTLDKDRIERLLGHFSEADKEMKKKIKKLTDEIDAWHTEIRGVSPEDEGLFYENFGNDYRSIVDSFKESKIKILKWLVDLKSPLNQKKKDTNAKLNLLGKADSDSNFDDNAKLNFFIEAFPDSIFANIEEINKIIELHNEQSDTLKQKQDEAKLAVKGHHFAEISPVIEKAEKRVLIHEKNINKFEKIIIPKIEEEIDNLERKLNPEARICEYINLHIKRFFGWQEINFSLTKNKNSYGYLIERNGVPAENLSEGEKTAITLIYFINQLQYEIELQGENGRCIIVIDDPISSFDSNFLYNAFSLLTSPMEGEKQLSVEQIFILTHNFEFLKLLLQSSEFFASKFEKKQRNYLMIKNTIIDDERRAYIGYLDKTLDDFSSEYHYLFCKLYKFWKSEATGLDVAYPIPNMMRKLLEIFTEFQAVIGNGLTNKLRTLEKKSAYVREIRAIRGFVNDKSHMNSLKLDPNLVTLSKTNLGYMFNMIERINMSHYEAMMQLLGNDIDGIEANTSVEQ